jgi:hypothetical protein
MTSVVRKIHRLRRARRKAELDARAALLRARGSPTPRLDRSQVRHGAGARATASAFSVMLCLDEGFPGGCTTFFAPGPSLGRSARRNTALVPRAMR